ncbi:hypothetical protein AAZX31_06G030400 [Glycine max]|uniref:Uncharacterized protein n=2 Tax=Glycine subgen. Soja TaxID=1462606 RepID=I1K7R8_SOYBN|nr:uncharacterized protein LOC100796598 [Glycine max]XP_006581209.1 uncharacterized protein LOC100796598 [Glycine max]XP_028234802.1 uncharacterized protein LOC114414656 [Glycine soja]KAH1244336.1 hypothetical protein GmHk_06G014991 [Glycine max]KAH1244337.1 hypothetical protein GmHk_06G014991 [Glycine max]KHN22253.1 hypothetical protein glysoja_022009 [Glycine soja]KRH51854.1 hypothetical protein GLYMA_06G032000v4 [Glycine max]RZC05555.1 hypothetical protein D0Y65_013606 [Glycine soja]|eukprot:XP_003528103.1 uncharacterized protein LOC100796598 [Glycine max]
MPLPTVVSPFSSSSGTFLSTVTARSSLPPKRNVSPSPSPFSTLSRRDIALLSFFSLSLSAPSSAIDIGISGPKDWLKEQKKKASKYLLAPVDASRQILRSAYLTLTETDAAYTDEDLEKMQQLFISAARDCVPQDRNSFVTLQANTGVEVCTFRLIVKNAASLLGNKDPVKLKAEALLDNLIRSFTSVSGLASETNIQLASDRKKIADAVSDTISDLDKFEQGIRDCLET